MKQLLRTSLSPYFTTTLDPSTKGTRDARYWSIDSMPDPLHTARRAAFSSGSSAGCHRTRRAFQYMFHIALSLQSSQTPELSGKKKSPITGDGEPGPQS